MAIRLPDAAPPELLARAKKLGAKSAGAAQFGRGAALAAPAVLDAGSDARAPRAETRRCDCAQAEVVAQETEAIA